MGITKDRMWQQEDAQEWANHPEAYQEADTFDDYMEQQRSEEDNN